MRTTRTIILSLLAAFAFSAVAAGAAQAKVPKYWYKGAELSGKLAIKSTSGESKLWVTELGVVIVCTADTDTGEIVGGSPGTNAKVTVTYTGCKLYKAEWNGTEWVVGPELSACAVKSPAGEPAGTIVTKELRSKLAYWPP